MFGSTAGKANKSEPQRFWTMQRRINHLSMSNTICHQSIKPWNFQLWQQFILLFSPLCIYSFLRSDHLHFNLIHHRNQFEHWNGRDIFTEIPPEYSLFMTYLKNILLCRIKTQHTLSSKFTKLNAKKHYCHYLPKQPICLFLDLMLLLAGWYRSSVPSES